MPFFAEHAALDVSNVRRIHFIAVAGTGMGSLATLLRRAGYEVTGSDANVYPPMSTQLEAEGIALMMPYAAANIEKARPDLVIVGNACKRDHVEVVEADRRGLPCTSFPAALGAFFLAKKKSFVVAGTHGKTTTTALLAWLLESAGRKPSFLVGGITQNFGTSARSSEGDDFVIEGDEYDSAFFDKVAKFFHYMPKIAVVTSVEFDHADIYADMNAYEAAFERFVAMVPKDGLLFLCADDPNAQRLAEHAKTRVIRYGIAATDAELRATDVEPHAGGMRFTASLLGVSLGEFTMQMTGRHNVWNALAAIGMAHMGAGVSAAEIQKGLAAFQGVKRRQEVRGEAGGVTVVDDFAHHPTAVRETIAAVKARHPGRRLVAIYEPRTNTARRAIHQQEYATAFDGADLVMLARPTAGNYTLADDERLSADKLAQDLAAMGRVRSRSATPTRSLQSASKWRSGATFSS